MSNRIIDSLEDKTWDEFVSRHPEGTIFHTSNWARVIHLTYGYKPCFLISETPGEIKAAIPFFILRLRKKRLVCLPFTDECSPLFTTEKELDDMVSIIIKMMNEGGIKNVEIRGGRVDLANRVIFKKYSYYKLFHLNLTPGLAQLWRNFKPKSIRYPIKKAQNCGVTVIKSSHIDDLKIFYKLNLLTRKKHGVVPQPYKFFYNIKREIFDKGYGFILIARYQDKPIAGSIFFTYKDKIYHKFNASHPDYLKYQPNHLILWEAIQWAVKNELSLLDLGRTSPDNEGLIAFKRHWGAKEIELSYYYWPEIKGASATKESSLKYKIASSVLKRTPIPILKIAGNLLYKHFG
ncbi:MAG: GNAT family N-acetyltransferase [candidate division WOR-3 bacterium]